MVEGAEPSTASKAPSAQRERSRASATAISSTRAPNGDAAILFRGEFDQHRGEVGQGDTMTTLGQPETVAAGTPANIQNPRARRQIPAIVRCVTANSTAPSAEWVRRSHSRSPKRSSVVTNLIAHCRPVPIPPRYPGVAPTAGKPAERRPNHAAPVYRCCSMVRRREVMP